MDTTPATTGKEIRTEESTGTTTLTRSRIWKPFGDIVLQVESTQFRVNRDSLADHSTVFADMLSIPQPPNEPAVEGCPVVILSGDSARDWEAFLGFLYDPFADQEALSLEVIAAMLRLGRKYEIAAAEANAVRRMHFEFPKDLDAWDKCSAHFTKIEDYDGLPLDILKLAHEFGINSSIPAIAFCCLEMHSLDSILTGMKRPDSSRIVLPPDVEKMLAIGFARIIGFQRTSCSWLDDDNVVPTSSCTEGAECGLGLNKLRRWCTSNSQVDLFVLKKWHEGLDDHFCVDCEEAAQDAFNAHRVKAWDALPTFFGLPKWDELKDEK